LWYIVLDLAARYQCAFAYTQTVPLVSRTHTALRGFSNTVMSHFSLSTSANHVSFQFVVSIRTVHPVLRPCLSTVRVTATTLPENLDPDCTVLDEPFSALSAHLLAHRPSARLISRHTLSKGTVRVRTCLHTTNAQAEMGALINASVGTTIAWAAGITQDERGGGGGGGGLKPNQRSRRTYAIKLVIACNSTNILCTHSIGRTEL
jgi:hypothetical protein